MGSPTPRGASARASASRRAEHTRRAHTSNTRAPPPFDPPPLTPPPPHAAWPPTPLLTARHRHCSPPPRDSSSPTPRPSRLSLHTQTSRPNWKGETVEIELRGGKTGSDGVYYSSLEASSLTHPPPVSPISHAPLFPHLSPAHS